MHDAYECHECVCGQHPTLFSQLMTDTPQLAAVVDGRFHGSEMMSSSSCLFFMTFYWRVLLALIL